MSNRKNFNSTVVTAGIVILLCLISLTGATLALFTSNPDDGKIGIVTTSGNVKIDIVDYLDEENSLKGDVLKFKSERDNSSIYFEPGATFYTQGFMVKNVGNIPVNYRMYISDDEGLDMEEFARTFEFYITTDPSDPSKTMQMLSFSGRLEVGDCSEPFYLVIKMKENAGNTFQKHEYSGIGITVCAVQGNVNVEDIE